MNEDLPYRIELWDSAETRVEEVIARVRNVIVARAAFTAAVQQYPNRVLTLRQGALVMAREAGEIPVHRIQGA
jgi:hypothetical protein